MPTYEFRCPQGHDFERFFGRISEAPSEVACPVCGELATRRISGGAGLIFKGSGFYITDYGKDGKKDQRTSPSGSSSTRSSESKASDSKGGESKGGESKGGDSAAGEKKGGDTGGGASKGGESGGSSTSDGGSAASSAKPAPPRPTAGE